MEEQPQRPFVRRVVAAANRYKGHLFIGARHYDSLMRAQINLYRQANPDADVEGLYGIRDADQGFVDQRGTFMDRKEALAVATAAGQLGHLPKCHPPDKLYSEDLY